MTPRIAIAHDYLTQRGGAERVVLSLSRAFPDATIHTLFYEPEQTYPEFRELDIRVSPLNRIGPFRRDPRLALPLLAPASSRMAIDADIVIASSSGWAHAFPTSGKKIVYCHSPARWLYLPEDYLGEAGFLDPKRLALAVLSPLLKRWDQSAAMTAETYLANSTVVQRRIGDVYGIDAQTLFPPFSPEVADGVQEPIPGLDGWSQGDDAAGGHYLVVSRLQPYKHVDQVVEAFRDLPDQRLLVVGRGPERERLVAMAPENVRFVEGISDAQLRWAYGQAAALIAASHEDFGLTPLEAGAHGVPTLALGAGGYLDTVQEGVNGLFFDHPEPGHIARTVMRSERMVWDRDRVREKAETFSESRFIGALKKIQDQKTPMSARPDARLKRLPMRRPRFGRSLGDSDGSGRAANSCFTVVIPTMQRSAELHELVAMCAAHPLVLEVIIINNVPEPIEFPSEKVKILQQRQNIFVNPAWNLGAREAKGSLLAIINDDVLFSPDAFDIAQRALRSGWFGVVGPDRSAFTTIARKPRMTYARATATIHGFGTFMCLRTRDYLTIPEQMRIWGGDDWLIYTNRRPPGAILGVPFRTDMSTTSGRPEIRAMRSEEQAIADKLLVPLDGTRWWHGPWKVIEEARLLRYRLKTVGRRL